MCPGPLSPLDLQTLLWPPLHAIPPGEEGVAGLSEPGTPSGEEGPILLNLVIIPSTRTGQQLGGWGEYL